MVAANVGIRNEKPKTTWNYITLIADSEKDLFYKLLMLYEQENVSKITVEKKGE